MSFVNCAITEIKMILWYIYIHFCMLQAGLEQLGFLRTLRFMITFIPVFTLMKVLLLLDGLVFPGYKKVKVENPVFIFGHPRSGTTFTHRLFTQTHEWCAWKTWELFVPSIIGRYLFKPLLNLAVTILSRGWHRKDNISEDAHEIKLDTYEEEEILFFWTMNTHFFHVFTPIAFSKKFAHTFGYESKQPDWQQKYDCKMLRSMLQRQIYYTGKTQVVAKIPYSTLRIRHLLEEFPDCRAIYISRPPTETLPSILSLCTSFHTSQYGNRISKQAWNNFYTNYADKSADLQLYFIDFIKNGCPENVKVVDYWTLRENLLPTFHEICDFCNLKPSDLLVERVRAQHERQASYVRKHKVRSLDEFGLSWESLMPRFAPIFEYYKFNKPE